MHGGSLRRAVEALAACWLLAACAVTPARAEDLPEYRIKAAFVYNFAAFAEWPAELGPTLNLCIHGSDPFGAEIAPLAGKKIGERSLAIQHRATLAGLRGCQIVFIAGSEAAQLPRVLEALRGQPVLTVADAPGALAQGVMLNMQLSEGRVTFGANLAAVRAARLSLSAKLLRLASEVLQ